MVAVMGQIAHPVDRANPYRIGHDGIARILPATGGINLSHRIGDRLIEKRSRKKSVPYCPIWLLMPNPQIKSYL